MQPGFGDGWLMIVENDGSGLQYGTFIGGDGNDLPLAIAVEESGEIFIAGYTQSTDLPVTPSAIQGALNTAGNSFDCMIFRLDTAATGGDQLLYGTYFGGSDGEDLWGLQVTGPGQIAISGATLSDDLPVTPGAYSGVKNSGPSDSYLGQLSCVPLGIFYCGPAVVNSTGLSGAMGVAGSNLAADNDLTLSASSLPPAAFGFFLVSQTRGLVVGPGGSAGNLCLAGEIGRYVGPGQIQQVDAAGGMSLALDLTQTPTPTGLVAIQAGETWNFQVWHRDSAGGMATSNFTNGVAVTFF